MNMSENSEGYEPSSTTVARSLAGREIGKMKDGQIKQLRTNQLDYKIVSDISMANDIIDSSAGKLDKEHAARSNREALSVLDAKRQGEYERDISKTRNDRERIQIQDNYLKDLKPKVAELVYDETGQSMNYTPLDTVHDIALVENEVYNETLKDALSKLGKSSKNQLTKSERKKLDSEIALEINKVMNRIGKNYLLGENLPMPSGDVFKDKAVAEVGKYVMEIRRKNKSLPASSPASSSTTARKSTSTKSRREAR